MSSLEFVKVRNSDETSLSNSQNVCVCCLDNSLPLIHLEYCMHVEMYTALINVKLENTDVWICNICHHMMIKCFEFKKQALTSYGALFAMGWKPDNMKKTINLITSHPETIDIDGLSAKADNINYKSDHNYDVTTFNVFNNKISDMKKEISDVDENAYNTDANNLITVDVKIESSSDMPIEPSCESSMYLNVESDEEAETDNPLSLNEATTSGSKDQTKKNAKNKSDYIKAGKVKFKVLTNKQLKEERKSDALKPAYLHLPYKCTDCLVSFDYEETFKKHLKDRHDKKIGHYHCTICKTYFNCKSVYEIHVARHFKRYECTLCAKEFRYKPAVVEHFETVHEGINRIYECKACDFVTDTKRKFHYHKEKHKGKQNCLKCSKTFVTKKALQLHNFTVHKESKRSYKCDNCSKTFLSRSGLSTHIQLKHDKAYEKTAFCQTCDRLFATELTLTRHLTYHRLHRTKEVSRFACEECGKKYIEKSSLRKHIEWTHLKIVKHKCDICDKPFKTQNSLHRHKQYVHEKMKQPKNKICQYCGTAFSTQRILRNHIRTHTGDRPFKCAICPATFSHDAALYNHNKIHK